MSTPLAHYANLVQRLTAALRELEAQARPLQLPPLAEREWYEVLQRKLLPQLGDQAFLVVAVTGGTNIGKSVVFNHLAGFRASASSPLASGTKHPVCLMPEGFPEQHDLAALFPSFTLEPWNEPAQALRDDPQHRLFWKTSPHLPPNLLLLDTPDIDSDAPVNWQRADAIRHSADVLLAVLTQQKYNDAAVKQFFRKAAAEGKTVVVVFNLCELPADEAYWPLWLQTFTSETGVVPEYVFVAPSDRKAAEELRLPFWERSSRESKAESREPALNAAERGDSSDAQLSTFNPQPSLQQIFSRIHFADIKLQSLRGSLALIADDRIGMPEYLREIAVRSNEFRTAAELLSTHRLAEIDDWPAPPGELMIAEVRNWWAAHRQGWTARVHSLYDRVGQAVLWPVQFARERLQGPVTPAWELYRRREWDAIVRAVANVYGKLEWLSELGNELLSSRLDHLLRGTSRADLIASLQSAHQSLDYAGELERTVADELQSFREENPQLFQLLRRMDDAAAAARPVLTVALGLTGVALPFGEVAVQAASQSMMQAAMHVAGEAAAAAVTVTVGETAISTTASTGVGYVQAKFHRLQAAFTARRAQWLAGRLESHLLGALAVELQTAGQVSQSPALKAAEALLTDWRQLSDAGVSETAS